MANDSKHDLLEYEIDSDTFLEVSFIIFVYLELTIVYFNFVFRNYCEMI